MKTMTFEITRHSGIIFAQSACAFVAGATTENGYFQISLFSAPTGAPTIQSVHSHTQNTKETNNTKDNKQKHYDAKSQQAVMYDNPNPTNKRLFMCKWNSVNLKIILWATLVGGAISSLVKSGTEANMPPRMAGEISPPAMNIDAWLGFLGINSHSLDYIYQGVTIPGAVMLYHWLFSFIFAFVYIYLSVFIPRVRMWYGAVYGILITLVMHGILIPALGFRFPAYLPGHERGWLWDLNGYEFWSELIGHICWSVSIEISFIAILAIFSRPICGKWTANKN